MHECRPPRPKERPRRRRSSDRPVTAWGGHTRTDPPKGFFRLARFDMDVNTIEDRRCDRRTRRSAPDPEFADPGRYAELASHVRLQVRHRQFAHRRPLLKWPDLGGLVIATNNGAATRPACNALEGASCRSCPRSCGRADRRTKWFAGRRISK